ncbi:MAG: restriction endonuclease [Candidatus Caccovivens sp.]
MLNQKISNTNKVELKNKYTAFIGLDKSFAPVYLDLSKQTNVLIASAFSTDLDRIIKNIVISLQNNNSPDDLEIGILSKCKTQYLKEEFIFNDWEEYTDEYECLDMLGDIEDWIDQNYSFNRAPKHIIVIIKNFSSLISEFPYRKQDINHYIGFILRNGARANVSLILCLNNFNAKILPNLPQNYFSTKICFRTNTPSESSKILGNDSASQIKKDYVAIYKNIDSLQEKEIKIIEENIKTVKETTDICEKYAKLKNNTSINKILHNFFNRKGYISSFELFAGKSKKYIKSENYYFVEIEKTDSIELNDLLKEISNSYYLSNENKYIFNNYQEVKNSKSIDETFGDIDKETIIKLLNLVEVYDSLCGQKLIDSDIDTKDAFYLLSYEIYKDTLKNSYQKLIEIYGINISDNSTIIETLYRSDKGISEIKKFIALKEFFTNNTNYYSFDYWLNKSEEIVEEQIKKYRQKILIENLLNGVINETKYKIADIDLMSGLEFENFIAKMFENMGYETKVTKSSGDQGVDVIAIKNDFVLAIQAKCYSSVVGNHAIMEAVAGMKYYKADKCMVITNSTFTKSAQELAKVNDVELWDRQVLKEKIEEIV